MDAACRVADAVMYEGYLLYPYRASATKNRVRWQFGVLVPPGFTATAEPSANRTECLLEGLLEDGAETVVRLRLRFLHLRSRTVERAGRDGHHAVPEMVVAGTTYLSFDEATEREMEAVLPLADLLAAEQTIEFDVPGDEWTEPIHDASGAAKGRIISRHQPVRAALKARAERLDGPYGLVKLHVTTVNSTAGWTAADAPRERALRQALISAHLLIGVTGGVFLSLLDPPEWARAATADCRSEHTWPVLAGAPGERDVLLSAPIILYDHPAIAPESPGHLFDSTEIDELLTLRTLTLTEQEMHEARATDPRAAELLERVTDMPPEMVERLHGAIRQLDDSTRPAPQPAPWRHDPGPGAGAGHTAPASDTTRPDTVSPDTVSPDTVSPDTVSPDTVSPDTVSPDTVSPDTDSVVVAGVVVTKGSRVRLRPGKRRADAHDMFLAGRTAVVEAVLLDVDGVRHLAVTLADDPGADLYRAHGRFRYFAPDEVEPIRDDPA
jgi:hypothetical protein